MATIKFKRQELIDMDLPYTAMEDDIIENTRWSIIHEIVFVYDNKFYQTIYSAGATEMQWEKPWEYQDEIECTEVHQVEKVVKVWEAV